MATDADKLRPKTQGVTNKNNPEFPRIKPAPKPNHKTSRL